MPVARHELGTPGLQIQCSSLDYKPSALLDTGPPGTSREIYNEDANGETRTRNPWITNPVL